MTDHSQTSLPLEDAKAALPDGLLEKQLDEWVESFPVDSLTAHLADLQRQRGTIEAAIESLNRRLAMWQALRSQQGGYANPSPKPTKRDAVLSILERDPTRQFSLTEIRNLMFEAGVLEDTPKARHALEATVSNMTKRREIYRPTKGHYMLARCQTPRLTPKTDLHRQEGEAA